jgi:hypothetical protein
MVTPTWLVAVSLVLTAFVWLMLTHFGVVVGGLIFAPVLLGGAVATSAYGGGVTDARILLLLFGVTTVFLLAADYYDIFGLQGVI